MNIPTNKQLVSNANDTLDYKHVWVNLKYLDLLNQTKSHAKSQQDIRIPYFGVNPYSYNPDEGRFPTSKDIMLIWKFQEGVGYELSKNNDLYSLNLDTADHGTEYPKHIDIKMISSNKLYMDNDTFIKTSCLDLNIIQNILIIAGKYELNGKTITFDSIGFIKGLEKYKHYNLTMNPKQDIIRFDVEDWCVYKYKGDLLSLYKCNCLEIDTPRSYDCIKCDTGILIYKLKKLTTHNTRYS